MKHKIMLYLFLGFIIMSCQKDKTISPDFLQGKWKEQIEGFQTHTNYFYYTFTRENNTCEIFIIRDKYYHSSDTTIFKKFILDEDKNTITLFEETSESQNKNVEKYKISQINSSTMSWQAVENDGNSRNKKMTRQ